MSPIKILWLVIASVGVFMATACGKPPPIEYDYPVYERILPAQFCPNDIDELQRVHREDGTSYYNNQQLWSRAYKLEHAKVILEKYETLFEEHPDVTRAGVDYVEGAIERGFVFREKVYIEVGLATAKLDQSELPLEKRIPHCLDGVPVHFLTNQPTLEGTPG